LPGGFGCQEVVEEGVFKGHGSRDVRMLLFGFLEELAGLFERGIGKVFVDQLQLLEFRAGLLTDVDVFDDGVEVGYGGGGGGGSFRGRFLRLEEEKNYGRKGTRV